MDDACEPDEVVECDVEGELEGGLDDRCDTLEDVEECSLVGGELEVVDEEVSPTAAT